MKIVDLSHPISPVMPVYPGTPPPKFKIGCTIEEDGFLEKEITMYSHTGTHIDAPAHLIGGAKTLDKMNIDHYFGEALMIDLQNTGRGIIELDDLIEYQNEINKTDFLLLNTGWSKYWGTGKYFSGYPVLSLDAASWLSKLNIKGVGMDTISADAADTSDFLIHKTLFTKDIVIVENLANLENVDTHLFKFSCFPLSIEEADGSPVRAIAYIMQ
ncbi:cyclase family protein [Desulforhopalus sp. 52FAK]